MQPYGYQVPTPNIQLLADQGVLFREAFCAAPDLLGQPRLLLTGQYCHNNGMLGLAHRGWSLNDYGEHLIHPLHSAGYHSVLIGEQHISEDPAVIGYDEVIEVDSHHAADVAPIAIESLRTVAGAVLHVGRVLRDPPPVRGPDLGARHALLAAAAQPARHAADARGHGRLQGERPLARPGHRRGAQRRCTSSASRSGR